MNITKTVVVGNMSAEDTEKAIQLTINKCNKDSYKVVSTSPINSHGNTFCVLIVFEKV